MPNMAFPEQWKPYALFVGFKYYPAPGWQGYVGDFSTQAGAEAEGRFQCREHERNWWQVVDLRMKKIVAGEGAGHTGLYGISRANPSGAGGDDDRS